MTTDGQSLATDSATHARPGSTLAAPLPLVQDRLCSLAEADHDPDLVELVWASFLLSTHEQFWSARPLESPTAVPDPGVDRLPPEDLAITESPHMHSALVYLNAARWARLADRQQDGWTHVDEGWLLQALPDRRWDGDLLPNVLIYNREVLLVLDRNGGCISHIFTRQDGHAYCVSGTPKCYQGLGPASPELLQQDHPGQRWYSYDGIMIQNTVWSPNHAYVCGDTALARPVLGYRKDVRVAEAGKMVGWLYPNLFDEYEGAITGPDAFAFVYQNGTEPAPAPFTLTEEEFLAIRRRDRAARTGAGGKGVIWHDPHHVGFRKTIRLDARTVSVTYEGVRPGHVVANEFCVHLQGGMRGEFHVKTSTDDGTAVRLDGPDGIAVRLSPTANCHFAPEVLDTGRIDDPIARINRLRLHRVLTDNLELVCETGGDFAYRIDL